MTQQYSSRSIKKKPIDITQENNIWCYDVEVFPNFFSVVFVHVNCEKSVKKFIIFGGINQVEDLVSFVKSKNLVLTGYNSIHYDNIIINFIISLVVDHSKSSVSDYTSAIYEMSCEIINAERGLLPQRVKQYKYMNVSYRSIDMMQIKPSSMNSIGLKQIAINLKWPHIKDSPLPFKKPVRARDINDILYYNSNDVLITRALSHKLKPQLLLRQSISSRYGISVINDTESAIADKILIKMYAEESGLSDKDFKNLRTPRDIIEVSDCISHKIKFQTKELKNLLSTLSKLTLTWHKEFKYKKTIKFGGNRYDLGVGGLHSKDKPGIFEKTDDCQIRDADVTSYYPFIVLNENICPAHLDPLIFKRVTTRVVFDRVAAKKSGDKVEATALKITINSGVFGKFNSEHAWVYDPLCMVKVTINGQLFLLMLIEMFYLAGIEVLSANTDGIICKVRSDQEELYSQVCADWQKATEFNLEYTPYSTYYRSNVNNYFTEKDTLKTTSDGIQYCELDDERIKAKGWFNTKIDLFKGYKSPVIPKAMYEYFTKGIPPQDTIRNHRDIYDFLISQKSHPKFQTVYSYVENGELIEEILQKNNRFYACLTGGALSKIAKASSRNEEVVQSEFIEGMDDFIDEMEDEDVTVGRLLVGQRVAILNDVVVGIPFEEYAIDYAFYEEEARKIIEEIQPKKEQLLLF